MHEGPERCVLCGRETEFSARTPVNQRQWYVDGCGQLCRTCYREVYEQPDLLLWQETLNKEMAWLLQVSRIAKEEQENESVENNTDCGDMVVCCGGGGDDDFHRGVGEHL